MTRPRCPAHAVCSPPEDGRRTGRAAARYSSQTVSETCAFCSEAPVLARYEPPGVNIVVMDGLTTRSDTAWACCSVCAAYIENGERAKLAHRSAEKFASRQDMTYKDSLRAVTDLHAVFWKVRPHG